MSTDKISKHLRITQEIIDSLEKRRTDMRKVSTQARTLTGVVKLNLGCDYSYVMVFDDGACWVWLTAYGEHRVRDDWSIDDWSNMAKGSDETEWNLKTLMSAHIFTETEAREMLAAAEERYKEAKKLEHEKDVAELRRLKQKLGCQYYR